MVAYKTEKEWLYLLILAAVQFAHVVDFVVMMPLGPRFLEAFKISPAQFAMLVSSYNYAGGISGIFVGTVADRYDRRSLMLFSIIGLIVGTALCAVAPTFETFILARIVAGLFFGTSSAITYAIITDIIPLERRGRAMSVIMSSFSVASVLGVPLGLTLADFYGWQAAFIFISGFSTLILLLFYLKFPSLKSYISGVGGWKAIKRYWEFIKNPNYSFSFLLILSTGLSMFILIPFLAPYAVKNMMIPKEQIKYMYLCGGAFTVFTARIFGKITDSWGPFRTFLSLAILSIAPVIVYTNAGPTTLIPYLAIGTFFMTIVSGRMIPCMTLLSAVPDEKERGGYMGAINSIRSFGSATAAVLGGLIITESANGKLEGFSSAGHLSIVITSICCFLAYIIAKKTNLYRPFFSK